MHGRRSEMTLICVAVAARAAAVLALQSHKIADSTYEHGAIAANLLAGRGFSTTFLGAFGPTSQQAPAYPVLVAGAYAIGGVGTPTALLIVQLGQALMGGLLVAGTMSLAREAAPGRRRVATLAGLVAALHPTLVYAATHIQVASLATASMAWTLALGYRLARTGSTRDAVAAGVALAITALTDPILGLSATGVGAVVLMCRGLKRSIGPLALVGLVASLCVLPWVARNYRVHGEFVPIKSSFGYAFWQGNCNLSQGTDKVVRPSVDEALQAAGPGMQGWNRALWEARHKAGYLDDIALSRKDYSTLASLTEPARSRLLFRRAVAELREEPGRYTRLSLKRLRMSILFDETNPKARSLAYRIPHLLLSLWAAAGWLLMPADLRRRLAPTLLVAALIAAFHALTIVSARFHIPIEPLMGLWGAAGFGGQPRRATAS